ncbi:riboflavin synthase [Hellea balneolensis]|uniref:riboflavin synthase n=1 Tax=Hellea balneolensis TaxID=287478 RepID=UPI00041E03FB|nr:riboflavin synthase [Hellea balneolensis]
MFTGIITDIGIIKSVTRGTGGEWGDTRMDVTCAYDTDTIDIGASISHSGACMTVIEKGPEWYAIEVSDESLSKTTLDDWDEGTRVNLERALTGKDEMGGHLVTGHVDGVGTLISLEEIAGSHKLRFEAPAEIAFGIAPKGSITIDGVSLTVNDVENNQFEVNIIPHTWQVTTLGKLQVGSKVNLEIDLIARYVARYLENSRARTKA